MPSMDGPIRILCVDDNRDAADSEALLLGVVGYEAQACYDGPTALNIADNFQPSICLLDLNMPGMEGDVLAQRLREQAKGRPLMVIAVTAMSSEAVRERTAGFDRHLVKPVAPKQLLALVNRLSHMRSAA